MRGAGTAVFVGILLLIAGVLDIIYGIAAVRDSSFYTANIQYVFSSLHTWGWISIIVGAILIVAAFSLFAGGLFGQVIGIFAASLGAISSLLNIGGPHPWWSIGVFVICILVIKGLFHLGEPEPEGV